MHRMITMNKNTLESFNLILLFGYYYCYNTFFIVRGVLSRNLFGKGWEEFGYICHP